MKIGVISDTHLRDYSPELKRTVDTYFHDVDMILHAGDIVDMNVLDVFLPKQVEAVAGNMDPFTVTKHLPEKKVIKVGHYKIGLIHGWGAPIGLEDRIRKKFKDIDCLVYGHTHYPVNRIIDGVLFFNPGSPTDRRFIKKNTLGILEINDKITGKIINL
ncbi:MAG: metallophosphoesterase family protein [Pseudomonadota bacterium]